MKTIAMLFALCAASLSPQSSAPAAAPPAGIDVITAYAGTWKTDVERLDTKFSKAGKETTILRNDCWRSAEYFSCHQYVDDKPAVLLVFTYDAKQDIYHSYVIPADGSDAHRGTLLIQGNTWIFPWEYKDDTGKQYYFQVVNVWNSAGTIDYRQEFSDDKVHWTVSARGHETKQK